MRIKNLIPRISWKSESEEIKDIKDKLFNIAEQAEQILKINSALTIALANAQEQANQYKQDAMVILTAIALQHGGELSVKQEFFDMQNLDDDNVLSLSLKKEDEFLHISVEQKTQEQLEDEEEETNNNE